MQKSVETQVTSAINIGLNLVAPGGPSGAVQRGADASGGFAALLEGAANAGAGGEARTRLGSAGTGAGPIALGTGADGATDAITDLLASLLETLAALTGNLDDDLPLDDVLMADLSDLLAKLEDLLGDGALPLPDSPGFAQLVELAKALGLGSDGGPNAATGPLDPLAALASKLAGAARDADPELSGRLTAFAQLLDAHAADIEAALRTAEPSAEMRFKLVESETKPNASAAIAKAEAAAQSGAPVEDGAGEIESAARREGSQASAEDAGKRSLVDPTRDAPAQAATRPAQAQAAMAAADPGTTDAPDGLTIQATQPQQVQPSGATVRPEAAAYQRPEPQINLPHIAAEISRHVLNGVNRFEIRLNPPELGRIDVRLEVDQNGNVMARLAVEKSETLDLMQRDQRTLERALADAGLDASKTDLEFSLKQDGSDAEDSNDRQAWQGTAAASEQDIQPAPGQLAAYRGYARLDAVDLRV